MPEFSLWAQAVFLLFHFGEFLAEYLHINALWKHLIGAQSHVHLGFDVVRTPQV